MEKVRGWYPCVSIACSGLGLASISIDREPRDRVLAAGSIFPAVQFDYATGAIADIHDASIRVDMNGSHHLLGS